MPVSMLTIHRCIFLTIAAAALCLAQSPLPVKWEELTAVDFVKAIQQAKGVCVLPFGIIEKHGPQLPLGTDLINARWAAEHGAQQEYAIVFPEYYFGQIFEARHQPGTVAYSARLQLDLLQETTGEMSRNGCQKIVIVNGHGGNNNLLPFFSQSQLASPRDYVVYVYNASEDVPGRPAMKSSFEAHAGESETSHVMVARPELVHMDMVGTQSGADLNRLDVPTGVYTGIWWYAKFPNHYGGDAAGANTTLGEFDMKTWARGVANVIRAAKADQISPRLQNEFYEKAKEPLATKQ